MRYSCVMLEYVKLANNLNLAQVDKMELFLWKVLTLASKAVGRDGDESPTSRIKGTSLPKMFGLDLDIWYFLPITYANPRKCVNEVHGHKAFQR